MNRKSFLTRLGAAVAALFTGSIAKATHQPAIVDHVESTELRLDEVWERINKMRLTYFYKAAPAELGFQTQAELEEAEYQMLKDLYLKGWRIFIEGRAYFIEGMAWRIEFNPANIKMRRRVTPTYVCDIDEKTNILYHMLKSMTNTEGTVLSHYAFSNERQYLRANEGRSA